MGFSVNAFSEENLAVALSNRYITSDLIPIQKGSHFQYFLNYLGENGHNSKTIVVEDNYISNSFLYDYSNFYSICFQEYKKPCKRVHFFSEAFTKETFIKEIQTNETSYISNSNYLGYIVIKPLPSIIIGATLLKPLQTDSSGNIINNCIREYKVNLFGKVLEISSLAFQEQDRVVSACATSALWSAFHKTSKLFQTKLPTPSEITHSAKNLYFDSGRNFPNDGLDHYQIGNSIEETGLVFELRNTLIPIDIIWLKSFIYGYLKMGLPVLLGLKFLEEKINETDTKDNWHLITITGFSEINLDFGKKKERISTFAERIKCFYAHDDQVGPYSLLGFRKLFLKSKKNDWCEEKIETSWVKNGDNLLADVESLIVPLSKEIRIKYEDVFKIIRIFDYYFLNIILNDEEIVWDVYLDLSNDYKSNLQQEIVQQNLDLKTKILTKSFPKYIWISKAYLGKNRFFEIIFDSSDFENGLYCFSIHIFDDNVKNTIINDLAKEEGREFFSKMVSKHILERLEEAAN